MHETVENHAAVVQVCRAGFRQAYDRPTRQFGPKKGPGKDPRPNGSTRKPDRDEPGRREGSAKTAEDRCEGEEYRHC